MSGLADAYADAHLNLGALDGDINQATAKLEQAVARWERILDLSAVVDVDTSGASTQLEAAVQQWNETLYVSGNVDLDTAAATDDLTAAVLVWQQAANVTGAVDLDTAEATDELTAALLEWRALLANLGGVSVDVELNTRGATEELGVAVDGWGAVLEAGLRTGVEIDTAPATAKITEAVAEWRALAKDIHVTVHVDDSKSLANLTATFEGLKPFLDLPVRFHVDGISVAAATAEIDSLAAKWASTLDLSVRVAPTGDNDMPRRPGTGNPAQPRGPNGDPTRPVIEPQVDGSEAEVQAKLLDKVLEGILKVTSNVTVDGDGAIAQAEEYAPFIARILAVQSDATIDGDKLISYAESLHALIEKTLGDIRLDPRFDDGKLLAKAEALLQALSEIMWLDIPVDVDDTELLGKVIALTHEVEALVGSIEVPLEPKTDPAKTTIEANYIKRLVEGLLKIDAPVRLTNEEAFAQAARLRPEIKALLDITADVDLDGPHVVAQAEAIEKLVKRVLVLNAPVNVEDKQAIAKVEAIRALLEGILRDITMKIEVNGGEATAELLAFKTTIEGLLGSIPVDVDLRTKGAEVHAVQFRALLKQIAGHLNIDVDLDTKAAITHLSLFRATVNAIFGRGDGVGGIFKSLALNADLFAQSFSKSGGVGGVLTGFFSSALSGGTALLGMFAKVIGILSLVGVGIATVTALVAALNAAIGALLVAAGGLIGLAGGFVTLAGGIGLAAGAAGALGVALNKDLLQQAKDGLTVLKNTVAAATRDVAAELRDRFLAPFIVTFTSIARNAARLTPLLVNPIAEAGLRYFAVANQILQSDVGASIAEKLGGGAAKFIDLFAGYLPAYSQTIDRLLGQTSGIHDLIKTILDLGLQAEPLFLSLGRLLSAISASLGRFGTDGLAIITRIADAITGMLNGAAWDDFVEFGAYALNTILTLIGQLADGIKGAGLGDVFEIIAEAMARLVDSGLFERLGGIIGMLLDFGARLLGPLVPLLESVAGAVEAILQPLLPVIEAFVSVFAEQMALAIDSLVSGGTLDALAEALGEILALATLLMPGLTQLIQLLGPILTEALKGTASLIRGIGTTLYEFTAIIIRVGAEMFNAVGEIIDFIADGARTTSDILGKVPAPILDRIVPGMSKMVGAIGDGADALDDLGLTAAIGAEGLGMAADKALASAAAWEQAGSAAERAGLAVEGSNILLEDARGVTEKYNDVLGAGTDTLAEYGVQTGMTTIEIDRAAEAAAQAAVQFANTSDVVSKLREKYSKPLELTFDFDKTKLNLDEFVTYVDAKVETVKEKASEPINTDPLTESLASQVVGADGTTLNDATSQPQEKFTPAHLETSIADSVQQMYDDAVRNVENKKFLDELRVNGFSALADQLQEFDGPKLELAIQELGDSTSEAVRAANKKILEAQAVTDEGFNPFQTAIDQAKKSFLAEARQAEIVAKLEGQGLSNLAKNFASLKPEDLEAAIRSYEQLSSSGSLQALEDQMVALRDAGVKFAEDIDPIGKMFQAAQNTPGAQQGLIGKVFTPEELDFLGSDKAEAFYNTVVKNAEWLASQAGKEGLPDVIAKQAERWRKVFTGTLGEGDAPLSDQEARVVAAREYRKLAESGGSVDPVTGEVSKGTAGVAEATDAGKAVANAFATSMTNADGSKIVEDAANSMVVSGAAAAADAAGKLGGFFTEAGLAITRYIGGGLVVGGTLHLAPAVVAMLASVIEIIDTALSSGHEMVSIGRLMAATIALGVDAGAAADLYPGVIRMLATVAGLLESGMAETARTAVAGGMSITVAALVGFTLGAVKLLAQVGGLGDDIADKLRDTEGPAVAQAKKLGDAIGKGVGDGLVKALSQVGVIDAAGGGSRKGALGAVAEAGKAAAEESSAPGVEIGKALIDGMILGMYTKLPELLAAATVVATMTASIMRSALQVKSPSQVTMTIGEQVVEGLARGIEAGHDRVVVAAQGLADRVSSTLSDGIAAPTVDVNLGAVDSATGAAVRPEDTPGWKDRLVDRSTFSALPPGVAMRRPEDAYPTPVGAFSAPQVASATAPQPTPQEASAAARAGAGSYITVEGDLNITGVPGAEQIPERTDGELWRLGYSEGPRRRKP